MSKRLPVFHIGANKAGSTTLQKALFARHPEVLNLGKPSFAPDLWRAMDAIRRACKRSQTESLQLDPHVLKDSWQRATAPAASDGRVPVVSHEELIRYHFYGEPNRERLPEAIRAMAGPTRVVIVIRHQIKLIESLYIHKANMVSYLPPERWLATQSDVFAYGYRFYEIAESWANVMGQENVGVFLFEDLVNDAASFAKRLCDFIGIDPETGIRLLMNRRENVRKSGRTQAYVRLRASLLPRASLGKFLPAPLRRAWQRFLEAGAPSQAELPPEWRHRLEEHYRSDNRKLAERFDLSLQKYGYPM